jgi:AraC family transcriptional activator of pyochelin receptor
MKVEKARIEVSHEMLSFVGQGALRDKAWPEGSVVFGFEAIVSDACPCLWFEPGDPDPDRLDAADLVFVVQHAACQRIFGGTPVECSAWHLPSELRTTALAILDCSGPEEACKTRQLGLSIELLCQIFAALGDDLLVPTDGAIGLSEFDAARIAAARRIVDEQWQEKLTLNDIARACGLNRDKLTRGFRSAYGSTVTDLLTENRLAGARRLLLATDMPISSIAYRCGYLSNASFTRAFARRFGSAPSTVRHGMIAA